MSEQDAPLGQCGRITDENKELICPRPAVVEVLVRTKFTLAVVRLCQADADEHREFYRRLNHKRSKRQRNRPLSTPTVLPSNSTPGSRSDQSNASNRAEVRNPGLR